MTIPMAIVDYIPVGLFLAAMCILQRDLYDKFAKWTFALFAGGSIMVFTAGFYKATWKLLYAAEICDFERLNQMFFPMQSTGFLLLGFAAAALLAVHRKNDGREHTGPVPEANVTRQNAVAAPLAVAVFGGTMLFVTAMVLGVGALCVSLAVIALRMRKKGAAVLFLLAFLFMLGMGYLSSKDFTQAAMNWAAQGVNVIGQGLLLGGTILLHKAGLRKADIL